ncbi:MAG TPA: hypothetical protein VFO21_25210 [Vicinamibacterales bacterium]|nr:hypothetical protein [Vicinamibacterales bacterium]
MFTRQLVMVVAGGLLVPPLAQSASPASPVHVTARLYNTARVPDVAKDAALRVATGALLAGGIGMRWKNCDIADSCAMVPARGELVIRLVRSPSQIVPRTLRRLGEGEAGPRNQTTPLVLGEAFIDTRERTGVLATVFVDHVELIAALCETDAALLLGRAIAHELGHLLLGSNAHSVRGLMRAQWTPADIRRHASADWALTTEDAAAIRRRLQ